VDTVDAAIRSVLDRVAGGDVSEDEVLGAIRRVRRDHVAQLATVEERADALAYAATVLGDAEELNRVSALYDRVTAADVERVAAHYLDEKRGATLLVLPNGEEEEVQDAA
jgi:predicted Zn-dependent peptidase